MDGNFPNGKLLSFQRDLYKKFLYQGVVEVMEENDPRTKPETRTGIGGFRSYQVAPAARPSIAYTSTSNQRTTNRLLESRVGLWQGPIYGGRNNTKEDKIKAIDSALKALLKDFIL